MSSPAKSHQDVFCGQGERGTRKLYSRVVQWTWRSKGNILGIRWVIWNFNVSFIGIQRRFSASLESVVRLVSIQQGYTGTQDGDIRGSTIAQIYAVDTGSVPMFRSCVIEDAEMCDQPAVISTLTQTPIALANNIWESRYGSLSEGSLLENGLTR